MVSIVQNLVDLVSYFTDVALSNPLSAFLLLFGFLFVTASSLVMAYLTAGAVVDFLIPESSSPAPSQRG